MCVNKPKEKIHIDTYGILSEYSFIEKTASRGFHVFKETTWNNVKERDTVRVDSEINKLSKNVFP